MVSEGAAIDISRVPGRDSLARGLRRAMATARSAKRPLTLCLLDLDHFKSINDAFGHARGDEVLAELIARLRRAGRARDLLFRYGGDEFVLLLPATDEATGSLAAERLVAVVGREPFPGDPPLQLTVSIGVAELREGDDAAMLLARADARLYAAKHRGRGRAWSQDPSHGGLQFDEGARLVERDHAAQALGTFLDGADGRAGTLLVINGVPGSGRTRLLSLAADEAARRGHGVLSLVATPALRTRLYGALAGTDWWMAMAGAAPTPDATAGALLRACVERGFRYLTVIVDDLEDLDHASVAMLRAVLATPEPDLRRVVLIAAAARLSAASAALGLPATELPIEPFSRTGTTIWLRGVLAWEPTAMLVDWLHQRTGGLPRVLRRAVDWLVEAGVLVPAPGGWLLTRELETVVPPTAWHAGASWAQLPEPAGPFVGRMREIQALKDLVEQERLVVIIGPGGAGKTRLALQAAAEIRERFRDGAALVALADSGEAAPLAGRIAMALKLPPARGEPLAALLEALRDRELLLLLDNWADEPAAAAIFVALRDEAPRISFLITAREPTRLPGERILALAGLSGGEGNDESRGEAAQLFTALVERADPAWQPDEHREAIGRICRQVNGLPLGVALAAAWTPFLGCEAVAEALERGPDLLAAWPATEGEPASRPALAAVASFWELMGPEERRTVRGLSPFRGGFTREGAGQVAAASLFLLGALVDRAFLGREPDGRYQMHELLRAYAAHELAADPEEEHTVRARHLTYVLTLAEQVHAAWGGPDWAALAARLEADHDNVRAAVNWALAGERGAEATQLAGALWRFWAQRGHAREGSGWLERALATGAPAGPRARALHGAGVLAYYRAEYATAALYLEEACCLQREIGNDAGAADACVALGVVAMAQGDYPRAAAQQEEGLAIYRARGDDRGIGVALNNLGVIAHEQGKLELAEQCYTESLASARRRGAAADVAFSLNNLGSIAELRGDYARAISLHAESLDLYLELGDRWGVAVTRMNLGLEWFESGQIERARDLLREALTALMALGDLRNVGRAMSFLARATWAAGDPAGALTLFAAAETLFNTLGAPPPPDEAEPARRDQEAAQSALGAAAELAIARGRDLPLEEVVAVAVADS